MTTVQTYRIRFESLSICQYKLWNIWIDPKVIYGLTNSYNKKSNFSYNSNSILKGLLRICSHEKTAKTRDVGGEEWWSSILTSFRDTGGSIWDLCILMGCRYMKILLWWLLCDGIFFGPLHAVDASPLYEDPVKVWSADWPCVLDMCNTARSFTHESNTCMIRRWVFLILGCIDLLSCIRSSLYEDPAEVRYGSTLCTWYV